MVKEKSMRFMMMIKCTNPSAAGVAPSPKLMQAITEAAERGRKEGSLLSTGGLLHPDTGVRVRAGNGKLSVIDGPYAETKELIGGFAIIKASSREDAIRRGKEFMQLHIDALGAGYEGEMEIRQMMDEPEIQSQAQANS
jgi:hypothetical protein